MTNAPIQAATPAPAPAEPSTAQTLRTARGFSCLFWSLPLLSAAHAAALESFVPPRLALGLLPACFLPLAWGLWMLGRGATPLPRWNRRVGRAALLALAAAGLSPFLAWWEAAPTQTYFAINAGAHYLATVALLASLNRLAAAWARGVGDAPLRKEAQAGFWMVLWLSACTVGALAWLFHRAGFWDAGAPAVLARLAALPSEARTLFLLPYAMTAYVAWRAKETGFRRTATAP